MTSRHWEPSLTNIFCYNPYSNSVGYNSSDILPPVSAQGPVGNCAAHALMCAVEARFQKARPWAATPKSIWRLSRTDLINTLEAETCKFEGFSLDNLSLAMVDSGVGLYDDHEASDWMDNKHPPGPKFRLSRIDVYGSAVHTAPGKVAGVTQNWNSTTVEGKVIRVDEVMNEIANGGPVLASFFVDWDFTPWSKENAKTLVYTGKFRDELSDSEQDLRRRHLVSLVGYGGEDLKKAFFIAQNSFGMGWGHNGLFLLDPGCIDTIGVPIL